jgi:hypothetical protein
VLVFDLLHPEDESTRDEIASPHLLLLTLSAFTNLRSTSLSQACCIKKFTNSMSQIPTFHFQQLLLKPGVSNIEFMFLFLFVVLTTQPLLENWCFHVSPIVRCLCHHT